MAAGPLLGVAGVAYTMGTPHPAGALQALWWEQSGKTGTSWLQHLGAADDGGMGGNCFSSAQEAAAHFGVGERGVFLFSHQWSLSWGGQGSAAGQAVH